MHKLPKRRPAAVFHARKKALFVGRFQPLHHGHVNAIERALEEFAFLTIGIGSSNAAPSRHNPFSYAERRQMLLAALARAPPRRFKIIPVPDFFNDRQWSQYLQEKADFDVVISGSGWVKRCFRGKKELRMPSYFERRKCNATSIRRKVARGESIAGLLPHEVQACLKKIGGQERVRLLYSDKRRKPIKHA